jgi:hypothetical protein
MREARKVTGYTVIGMVKGVFPINFLNAIQDVPGGLHHHLLCHLGTCKSDHRSDRVGRGILGDDYRVPPKG